jgi:LPXTG-motif cell wall-anchored protein
VPSVCRRIVVLLAVACLGAGTIAVPVALAQSGGGDQQYQDPFGGNGDSGSSGSGSSGSSNSGGSGSSSSGSSSDDDLAPLSPSPQTSGSGTSGTTSSGSGSSAGTATAPTPATTGSLPNTGLDTRVLVIAGGVLLLLGVGLRMRNAPERY